MYLIVPVNVQVHKSVPGNLANLCASFLLAQVMVFFYIWWSDLKVFFKVYYHSMPLIRFCWQANLYSRLCEQKKAWKRMTNHFFKNKFDFEIA